MRRLLLAPQGGDRVGMKGLAIMYNYGIEVSQDEDKAKRKQ